MRIVIVEDDTLMREGLRLILSRNGHQVEAHDRIPREIGSTHAGPPDLLLTDIRLPPSHRAEGLGFARSARVRWPELNVLLLSAHIETSWLMELFESSTAGTGYLLKDRIGDVSTFMAAVERVGAGGSAVDPEVFTQALRRGAPSRLDQLSEREREVLAAIAEGLANREIATRLFITESAVNKHVGHIFEKLELHPGSGHRRVQAVLAYLESPATS